MYHSFLGYSTKKTAKSVAGPNGSISSSCLCTFFRPIRVVFASPDSRPFHARVCVWATVTALGLRTHVRARPPPSPRPKGGAAATLKLLSVAPQRQDDSGALSFPKERGQCKYCSCNLAADEEQRRHRTTVPGHGPILTTVSHLPSAM